MNKLRMLSCGLLLLGLGVNTALADPETQNKNTLVITATGKAEIAADGASLDIIVYSSSDEAVEAQKKYSKQMKMLHNILIGKHVDRDSDDDDDADIKPAKKSTKKKPTKDDAKDDDDMPAPIKKKHRSEDYDESKHNGDISPVISFSPEIIDGGLLAARPEPGKT